ncbi:MAG: ComF family protein [Candidatus Paceibacteria bacterium]
MRLPPLSAVLNLLFPPHKDVERARCVTEATLIQRFHLSFLPEHRTYTALSYADADIRALIKANKYHADRHAARLLGAALNEAFMAVLDEHALEGGWERPLLVPMPSAKKRHRERGYNQVERIVEALPEGTLAAFCYAPRALTRDDRQSQARVAKARRAENVRGAFSALNYGGRRTSPIIAGAHILLIDDVIESGATMADAMRALREAGAADIVGIALAH